MLEMSQHVKVGVDRDRHTSESDVMARTRLAFETINHIQQRRYGLSFWYVLSPFSNYARGHQQAFKDAVRFTASLHKAGVRAFSPIAAGYPMSKAGLEAEASDLNFWMWVNEPYMRACHGGIVAELPGWRESVGVAEEIKWFQGAGKPVIHLPVEMNPAMS